MATKLLCPQCRIELPNGFERGESGECPRCRATFSSPRERRPSPATAVLQSRPYAPVVDSEPSARTSYRLPILITAIAGLIVLAGIAWLVRIPTPAVPKDGTSPSSLDIAARPKKTSAASKSSAPTNDTWSSDDDLAPQRSRPPRIRVIRDVDSSAPPGLVASAKTRPLSKAVDAAKVDEAVRKGIEYLTGNRHRWIDVGSHTVGYAALPGLALLEVGVPGDHPAIVEAARVVRTRAPQLNETYEMSLAILFLDRLGDTADRPMIRSLALRLITGQTSLWGWDYRNPRLPAEMETPLETVLQRMQPPTRWQTPLAREPGKGLIETPLPRREGAPTLEKPLDRGASATPLSKSLGGSGDPAKSGETKLVMPLVLGDPDKGRDLVKELPAELRSIPGLKMPGTTLPARGRPKGKWSSDRDDNSNTQFALLALWAARRHGIPVDRALLLADHRFAQSQASDGSWGYHVHDKHGSPTMTCVGLLGLGLGHGAMLPIGREPNQPPATPAVDPAIQRGLEALGRRIGTPQQAREDPEDINLYYLWSVERVGMMYQLATIGGKDWYGWGATLLLGSQRPDGSWPGSDYPGSATAIDTAFALLFLNRSNLVHDLTERLQLHMAISDR